MMNDYILIGMVTLAMIAVYFFIIIPLVMMFVSIDPFATYWDYFKSGIYFNLFIVMAIIWGILLWSLIHLLLRF